MAASFFAAAAARLRYLPALGLSLAFTTFGQGVAADDIRQGEPCHLIGLTQTVQCHRIDVPLDHNSPEAGTLQLHAATIPARERSPKSAPLVLLAGGPGQAAAELGRIVAADFFDLMRDRDVLLVDMRGTGKSRALDCPALMFSSFSQLSPTFFQDGISECRQDWGADVQYFSSEQMVNDLEAVRKYLGYPQFDLYGVSWGTRLGLLYMRAFPDSVRAAVFDGVAPPNASLFEMESQGAQAALTQLFSDCAADPACAEAFPQLESRFAAWLENAPETVAMQARDPVTGELTRQEPELGTVMQWIRVVLYSNRTSRKLPFAIDRLIRGNGQPLAALAGANSNPDMGQMYLGMSLSVLCSEEVLTLDPKLAPEWSRNSFTGTSYFDFWYSNCRDWPQGPVDVERYRAPVTTDAPVLLLSGGLDPITTPAMAEIAAKSLPTSWHIVVPGLGHNVGVTECTTDLITDFFRSGSGDALATECIDDIARPAFMVSANGPRP